MDAFPYWLLYRLLDHVTSFQNLAVEHLLYLPWIIYPHVCAEWTERRVSRVKMWVMLSWGKYGEVSAQLFPLFSTFLQILQIVCKWNSQYQHHHHNKYVLYRVQFSSEALLKWICVTDKHFSSSAAVSSLWWQQSRKYWPHAYLITTTTHLSHSPTLTNAAPSIRGKPSPRKKKYEINLCPGLLGLLFLSGLLKC